MDNSSREKVLKKVRNALINPSRDHYANTDFNSDIYVSTDEMPELTFAQNFTNLGGHFIFCPSEEELREELSAVAVQHKWKNIYCADEKIKNELNQCSIPFYDNPGDFLKAEIGITLCEFLVSRTGSIIVSSKQSSGRRLVVYPEVHVVIAYTSQILVEMKEALQAIRNKYGNNLPSFISAITGPSRTADIEKTLVKGAHGPKEIYVFLVDDPETTHLFRNS